MAERSVEKVPRSSKAWYWKTPKKEPDWLIILDPIFSETHATLELATKGCDVDSESSREKSIADGVDSSLGSSGLSFHDGDHESLRVENEDTDDDDSARVKEVAPAQQQVIHCRRKAKPKSQAQLLADLSQRVLNIYKSMEERAAKMMEEEKA